METMGQMVLMTATASSRITITNRARWPYSPSLILVASINEHGENSDPFNDLKDAFELDFCFIWKNKALHRDQGCAGADNDPDMLFLFFH